MGEERTDFSRAAEHMWDRHRILNAWVEEAFTDEDRVILDPDPASRSGRSLRVVGFSSTFGHPITIVAIRRPTYIEITSASRSNARDQRVYRERQGNDGQ